MKLETDTPIKHQADEVEETVAEQDKVADETAAKAQKKDKKVSQKAEIAALLSENQALKTQLDELTDTHQRVLAEYANFKRRNEQEKAQVGLFTKCDIMKALIPTIDSFERAADSPSGEEYKAGIEMIVAGFVKTLNEWGLSEIPAAGQPFNPELHHAVMREDAAGGEDAPDAETVTEVFQKGYTVGEKVIRPAMVKVAN